jgi:hypothetical protein
MAESIFGIKHLQIRTLKDIVGLVPGYVSFLDGTGLPAYDYERKGKDAGRGREPGTFIIQPSAL